MLGSAWLEGRFDNDWIDVGFLEFLTCEVIARIDVWHNDRVVVRPVSDF